MASVFPPWTFGEWQALAARDPAEAGREVARRLASAFSPEQQRAVLVDPRPEDQLISAFERVANTIAPLAGIPYVLKDLFFTANEPLRAGSQFPPGVIPTRTRDSKLPHALRGFGAVLAAKSQLHEFAYGLTGENPHFGHCEHPSFPGRTSGGSSSGSAAAVAAGVVPFAVGTDTGGSIRVPAAFCGLYGYRSAAGNALIADAFPLAPSYDAAGWFTRHPEDLLMVLRFLVGKPAVLDRTPRGCFVDLEMLGAPAEPEVATAVRRAMERFAFAADRDTLDQLRHAFEGSAEAYGVLQSMEAYQVHAAWLDTHRDRYDPAVWARIDRGRRWTPEKQQQAAIRQVIVRNTWTSFFLTYDYLILPIAPFPALPKEACTQANRDRLLALTTPVSLAGLPALTLPVPLQNGLTTGIQVVVNDPNSPVLQRLLKK